MSQKVFLRIHLCFLIYIYSCEAYGHFCSYYIIILINAHLLNPLLLKQETELVYNTYGDDVGVAYAESIKNFSKNCEYATIIVDNLLDILTGNEHKKTSKYIEEQKLLRSEESLVKSAFNQASSNGSSNGASPQGGSSVDFDSLRSLAKDGIDMSFLESLQTQYTRYIIFFVLLLKVPSEQ